MKAKSRSEVKRSARPKKAPPKPKPTGAHAVGGDGWRLRDLPADLQAELRHRLEEAKRGENLIPFDDAAEDAERMADQIVEILTRPHARRPSE